MELFPRSTRGSRTWPREIEYTILAYMTLANTQTILVHLTWKFYWLTRGLESEMYFEDFKTSRKFLLFLHFTFLIRAWNVVKTWWLILQVVQKNKLGKRRQKEYWTTWKCLNCQKTSRQLIVCHRYETLADMQNIFVIILFRASEDVKKRFEETLYKWDNGKKKKRQKVAFATKNA